MRAQVGSIWQRTDGSQLKYEVIGFSIDDRIRLRSVDYPAVHPFAVHPQTFHLSYVPVEIKPPKSYGSAQKPGVWVREGQIWTSKANGRSYFVDEVDDDALNVEIVSLHVSQATGRPYRYKYTMERFLRTCILSAPAEPTTLHEWSEVERTLRAYSESNREHARLEAALQTAYEAVNTARAAIDDHRKVVNETSAEYSTALNVMEARLK